jgi:hypothetical protein
MNITSIRVHDECVLGEPHEHVCNKCKKFVVLNTGYTVIIDSDQSGILCAECILSYRMLNEIVQ